MEHICEHKLLSSLQFGFRPGASTAEAILSVTRACHDALEKGNSLACVLFDISKAFDSLSHYLIIHSLARVGICGNLLAWIADYLTNRLQKTVLSGAVSSIATVTSGVPQGSILGPLLFILLMDSISSVSLSPNAALSMYADDICYYVEVAKADDIAAVQVDVDAISNWAENSDLRLNSNKTKALLISRKRKPPALEICLNDCPIEQVDSYKYLGVLISSDLSWSLHINWVCSRAKQLIGFLYRHLRLVDSKCVSRVYQAIVLPILNYCSAIWDPYHQTYINKLERVQFFLPESSPSSGCSQVYLWMLSFSGLL